MVHRARNTGLRVALVDVLPWNNGDAGAANEIARLNGLIRAIAENVGVPLFSFNETLADPARPSRMRDEWTDDGDHPSVDGHRLLGERAFRPF
jgi:lysophospholipase L1-like esterase